MTLRIAALSVPLVVIWWVVTWNRLVKLRNHVRESWANVDVVLQRRHDLIPNLVETVKGFVQHEKTLLTELVEARERCQRTHEVHGRRAEEQVLVSKMNQVLMRAEAYPQLLSSQSFLSLQEELIETEDRIAAARRFYNANVRDYNTAIHSFPSSLVAGMGKHHDLEFFEIADLKVRALPSVAMPDAR